MNSHALTVLSILVMLVPVLVGQTSPVVMTEQDVLSGYVPHGNISITGNDDFSTQASSEGWAGNGSPSNPYLIESLNITGSQVALSMKEISVSFVIRDCVIITSGLPDAGVSLANSSRGCIEHCHIRSPNWGVVFFYVYNCTLDSNTIESYHEALSLTGSYNCTFRNNILVRTGVGFWTTDEAHFRHVFENNTVYGRQLAYFWNVTDMVVDASLFGQLVVVSSKNLIIRNGMFAGTQFGPLLVNCQDCVLQDCTTRDTTYGLVILSSHKIRVLYCAMFNNIHSGLSINRSSDCVLETNMIYRNMGAGIEVSGRNVTIINNAIRMNQDGIVVYSAGPWIYGGSIISNTISENFDYGIVLDGGVSGFRVYGNMFLANGLANARDDGWSNSWDDGAALGNCWDDYSGSEYYYNIQGYAASVDHYPWFDLSHTTSANETTPDNSAELPLWFFLSVAVMAVPVFLLIRRKESRL